MEKDLEIDDIDKNTWNKVEKTALNAGYRDGISDGREQNFQSGFDKGYKLGFQAGFTLGYYKASLRLQENDDKTVSNSLSKASTGDCQLCNIKNIENEEISTLEKNQKENYEKNLLQLKNDYPEIELMPQS